MSRRKAREKALQSLYQIDIAQSSATDALAHVLEERERNLDEPFLRSIVEGTVAHVDDLDKLLQKYSVGWEIDRMPSVDRNILRLAVFELLYHTDTPERVVVNEAVELAKSFSTDESGKFINGVLGKLLKDLPSLRESLPQE